MTRSLLRLFGVLAFALTVPARADQPQITHDDAKAAKVAPYKLGLSAPLGNDVAQKDGEAVAASLSATLGHPVTAEVLTPAELSSRLANGTLDIGWLTALEYVQASKASNGKVTPVAKALHAGLPFYRSVLFAMKKSRLLRTPADLLGKKIAFVADTSSAGYVIPYQMLLAAGLTDAQIKAQSSFFGDHAAVCRAVLAGTADAGATLSNDKAGSSIAGCAETLGARAAELKVLSTSDPIPNDVFVLKPGATTEEFANLRSALLDLDKSLAGKKLLAESLHADGFTPADDGDFAPLRASMH